MKKLLLAAVAACFSQGLWAQATLEHEWDFPSSINYQVFSVNKNLGGEVTHHVGKNQSEKTLEFFNADYSLRNSFEVDNEIFLLKGASTHLFNNDDLIEIYVVESLGEGNYAANLYNEEGTLLQSFGNYIWAELYSKNGGYKMQLTKHGNNNVRVYALDGNFEGGLAVNESTNQHPLVYPNPAQHVVQLPYELPVGTQGNLVVYNQNGQLIKTFQVSGSVNELRLDVSQFQRGIYFYECEGKRSKFIVN